MALFSLVSRLDSRAFRHLKEAKTPTESERIIKKYSLLIEKAYIKHNPRQMKCIGE